MSWSDGSKPVLWNNIHENTMKTVWNPWRGERLWFLRHITILAPHHHFRARAEMMDINQIQSFLRALLPSPKPKWLYTGMLTHRAALLKACFQLGLVFVPTGSKDIIPTVFYFLFSQGLSVPGTMWIGMRVQSLPWWNQHLKPSKGRKW